MITEEFRESMVVAGFSVEDIKKAVHCFDSVMINYNVTKKDANIVSYDAVNINQRYLDLYLKCRKFEGVSKSTLTNHSLYLGKYIDELNCSVLDATTMNVRLFLSIFQEQGYSNESVEKVKSCVSAFYRWLISERQTSYNPCSAIPKIKTAVKFQGALNSEELRYLKFACKNERESLLIEFLVSTGCRIAEFVNIKLSDIDISKKSALVKGKGNKEREVYFSSEAKILILNLYGENFECNQFLYGKIRGKGKLNTCTARLDLEKIAERTKQHIKLEKITPHTLRRTFATSLLRKGVALEIVSKLLGHSQLQTTMRYISISDDTLMTEHQKYVA